MKVSVLEIISAVWISLETLRSSPSGAVMFHPGITQALVPFLIQSHAGIKPLSSSQLFFYQFVYIQWLYPCYGLHLCCVGVYPTLNE